MRSAFSVISGLVIILVSAGWTPLAVTNDPLVRMPGTQPGQITLEAPNNCMNCHAGYDELVEPGFNWQGSMMGQTARDPLFFACFTVAAQDSIWALGNPNAVDLCMRCHFPKGWLEGRSDPVNASLMIDYDWDGVQCDFCHSMVDPFFHATFNGTREGVDWTNYWDESNLGVPASASAAEGAYDADTNAMALVRTFANGRFFEGNVPATSNYLENGAGQYYISILDNRAKRASFTDAAARHSKLYSRYHKSKFFCQTCHDVSNPALANLGHTGTNALPSEANSPYSFFHVERTFSEFMLSDYGQQGGAAGTNHWDPASFDTSRSGNLVATCQDCHMSDGVGKGCNKRDGILRPDESIEHPMSGQPVHDFTGGNTWIPWVLASSVSGSPNYNSVNDDLLNQGAGVLTLDTSLGLGLNPDALLAGVGRARTNLLRAASFEGLNYDFSSGACSFKVVNHTGHKLLSGFPEGRRMFVSIEVYAGTQLVYAVNPYDEAVATLKGLSSGYSPSSPALDDGEVYEDALVYEMHPSSSLTGEEETFHFALADSRYKDNRIPPRGFRIDQAGARLAEPVWHGVSDSNYFSAAEYAGGYDEVELTVPCGADRVEARLYYQVTSREYIEFLRDEINGTASTLSSPGAGGDPAYLIQTDAWFAGLRAWGNTIWGLWTNSLDVDGVKPALMASATLQLDTSDEDGDGIPAYWETQYFGGPTNASPGQDSDGDGVLDYTEYVTICIPTNVESRFEFAGISDGVPGGQHQVSLAFTSHVTRMYCLEYTTNPVTSTSWEALESFRRGTGGADTMTDSNTVPGEAFYRIGVKVP